MIKSLDVEPPNRLQFLNSTEGYYTYVCAYLYAPKSWYFFAITNITQVINTYGASSAHKSFAQIILYNFIAKKWPYLLFNH